MPNPPPPVARRARRLLPASLLLALAACKAPTTPNLDMPSPSEARGVRVELHGLVRRTTKLLGVYGEVTNSNGQPVSECTIRYEALDSWGTRVARAEARLGPLAAGERREFQAPFDESNVTSISTILSGPLRVTLGE